MWAVSGDWPLWQPTLYGIEVARDHIARNGGQLILVEGEYDAIAMHAAGFTNTVAVSGALTDAHVSMLRDLHVSELVLLFDGDEAGRQHATRAAEAWWDSELAMLVAELPEDKDPDDSEPLEIVLALGSAKHALEWLLWQEWNREPRASFTAKMQFVEWIRATYGERLRSVHEALLDRTPWRSGWEWTSSRSGTLSARSAATCSRKNWETIVLGRALRQQSYFVEIRRMLAADDFYLIRHRRLWKLLEETPMDGIDPDLATAKVFAGERGLEAALVEKLVATPEANLAFHENRVLDMSLRRSARDEALSLKERITDHSIPADQTIGTFTHAVTAKVLRRDGGTAKAISEQVDEAMDTLHERMANPTEVHGLHPGSQFPSLARTLQGFQPRRFVLLTASSGVGKSTLSLQLSTSLAVQQAVPVDYISLEMDQTEILYKVASHLTGIDSMRISGGALDEQQARLVEQAMALVRRARYAFTRRTRSRRLNCCSTPGSSACRAGPSSSVIDYAQLDEPGPGVRTVERLRPARATSGASSRCGSPVAWRRVVWWWRSSSARPRRKSARRKRTSGTATTSRATATCS